MRNSYWKQDTQDRDPNGIFPFYVRSPIIERSNKYTFEGPAILMAGDGVGAGRVFHYVDGQYGCHQRVYSLQKIAGINRRFLYYYLSNLFYRQIEVANSKSTVDSVRLPMLQDFPVVFPDSDSQQKIANYLDCKCTEIDVILEKTLSSIEEYKKLKQAIITQAVTKGIRGDRPMKDSGLGWIGEIPVDWKVCKIKNICKMQTGNTPSTEHQEWFGGKIKWFTPGDFNERYDLIESSRTLSEQAKKDNAVTLIPPHSVMVIGIGGTAGKIGYTLEECSCNQQVTALYNILGDSRYLMYWMISASEVLKKTALYNTLPILNNQTIGSFVFVGPTGISVKIQMTIRR